MSASDAGSCDRIDRALWRHRSRLSFAWQFGGPWLRIALFRRGRVEQFRDRDLDAVRLDIRSVRAGRIRGDRARVLSRGVIASMQRIAVSERADWGHLAEQCGFAALTPDGEPYWDETAYYALSFKEIEDDLEAPTAVLDDLCRELVARAIADACSARLCTFLQSRAPANRNSRTILGFDRRQLEALRRQPVWTVRPATPTSSIPCMNA